MLKLYKPEDWKKQSTREGLEKLTGGKSAEIVNQQQKQVPQPRLKPDTAKL